MYVTPSGKKGSCSWGMDRPRAARAAKHRLSAAVRSFSESQRFGQCRAATSRPFLCKILMRRAVCNQATFRRTSRDQEICRYFASPTVRRPRSKGFEKVQGISASSVFYGPMKIQRDANHELAKEPDAKDLLP